MSLSIIALSFPRPFTDLSSGRLKLSSRLARTVMDILAPKISLRRLIQQLTFSKAFSKAFQRLFSFLTMPQAIKNELWMRFQHGKCRKVHHFQILHYFF
jgi:hypothetical protein